MIYFDNAATTFPKPQIVYDSVDYAMKELSFNAGRGSYKYAKDTFNMIEETRKKIASLINVTGDKVIFTSSATEAINSLIVGLELTENDCVYISPFEHNAIVRTLNYYKIKYEIIPFNKNNWEVDYNKLNDLFLMKKPKAIIISHVSNTTGFLLPYQNIFELSKKFGAINILDAAQSFGIKEININNIDAVVFAGHKSLYGLFGIGGYINISKLKLKNYIIGGTGTDSLNVNMPTELPYSQEAGSPNSIAIYSIYNSIDFIKYNRIDIKEEKLVQYFLEKVKKLNKVIVYLPENYISEGIVSFNVLGYSSNEIGIILSDEYDICVRTGYHCAPLIHDFIDSKKYYGTVRISFGAFNTNEEIDCLIKALSEL